MHLVCSVHIFIIIYLLYVSTFVAPSSGRSLRYFLKITVFFLQCCYVGYVRERDQWGDPGVNGRILLRRIFRKWDVKVWTVLSWLRIETGGGQL
jgi:hypothetical protein